VLILVLFDVVAREGGRPSIPEASRSSTAVSGILDRPIKSRDDSEVARGSWAWPGTPASLRPENRSQTRDPATVRRSRPFR